MADIGIECANFISLTLLCLVLKNGHMSIFLYDIMNK